MLRTVGKALQETVRNSDYVARWDGDAFLVAGMSNEIPPATLFKQRIEAKIEASGINLGKRSTTITVRTTAGNPEFLTFDDLLQQVQHDSPVIADQ